MANNLTVSGRDNVLIFETELKVGSEKWQIVNVDFKTTRSFLLK